MGYIEKKNETTFNIFWECNQTCPFCSGYPKREFDLERDIFEKIRWLEEISLQGWEPTLSPHLFEIISFARVNGTKRINLITNGLKIADRTFSESIAGKIDCYHFAFMSHNPQKADILGWTQDTLKLKSKALLNLISLGEASKIRLVHIIQNENIQDLPNFPDFVNRYFPWVRLIEFKYIQYFGNKNNLLALPKYSDVREYLNKAFSRSGELWFSFLINGIPLCFLEEKFHLHTASYYNINDEKQMEQYSTVKLGKCQWCRYSDHCIWVRQDYILLQWDEEFR